MKTLNFFSAGMLVLSCTMSLSAAGKVTMNAIVASNRTNKKMSSKLSINDKQSFEDLIGTVSQILSRIMRKHE